MGDSRMKRLVAGMDELGIRHVFGLPGTQNVSLFEALRRSTVRAVPTTSELAAAFAAVGYARVSGAPAVLATIPGPGFAYALPGLAEARLDSAPVVHVVVGRRSSSSELGWGFQAIPHLEMARPLVKAIVPCDPGEDASRCLREAWHLARAGEPGPVLLWVDTDGRRGGSASELPGTQPPPADAAAVEGEVADSDVEALVSRLAAAERPLLFLGLGALGCSEAARALAERLGAPFFTTPSARGVIPEDHPLCLEVDFDRGGLEELNSLIEGSDLVLALGCKFSHNGTGGFRLRIPEDRLVHVNADRRALGHRYPASLLLHAEVEAVLPLLLASLPEEAPSGRLPPPRGWSMEELASARARMGVASGGGPPEPSVQGIPSGKPREFVQLLRRLLPRDGIVVTDSGLHQVLVRRHFRVLAPQGLLLPTDFQSMGFGLPAALGAALAAPGRKVVAVIGDGGMAMSGMELLTLVRESLPVTVIVFNDGHLNLIRLQQERDYGYAAATALHNPDLGVFAEAAGAGYVRLDAELEERLGEALEGPGPVLAEVVLGDSAPFRARRRAARAKSAARAVAGEAFVRRIKRILGRD